MTHIASPYPTPSASTERLLNTADAVETALEELLAEIDHATGNVKDAHRYLSLGTQIDLDEDLRRIRAATEIMQCGQTALELAAADAIDELIERLPGSANLGARIRAKRMRDTLRSGR